MPDQPLADSSPAALNNRPPSTHELLTQLTSGPTSREVAAVTLRTALTALYPSLDIDQTWPWSSRRIGASSMIGSSPPRPKHLAHLGAGTPDADPGNWQIYLDGEHFLTLQPGRPAPVHLPVKSTPLRACSTSCPNLMLVAQEQYLKYWNASNGMAGPRWRVFARPAAQGVECHGARGLGRTRLRHGPPTVPFSRARRTLRPGPLQHPRLPDRHRCTARWPDRPRRPHGHGRADWRTRTGQANPGKIHWSTATRNSTRSNSSGNNCPVA